MYGFLLRIKSNLPKGRDGKLRGCNDSRATLNEDQWLGLVHLLKLGDNDDIAIDLAEIHCTIF